MLLREVDPNRTDGVVGAGRNLCLRVRRVGVPEQRGVVIEAWMLLNAVDFPRADGQRVMLAATGHRRVKNDAPRVVQHGGSTGRLGGDERDTREGAGAPADAFGTMIASPACANVAAGLSAVSTEGL